MATSPQYIACDNSLKYFLVGYAFLVGLLSTASVIFGLISWIMLPKWRQFRHYVLINQVLINSLPFFALAELPLMLWPNLKPFIGTFAYMAIMHWFMVTTVMFYIDFVKVFTGVDDIKHIYLKANAFGWLLPIMWAAISQFFEPTHYITLIGVPLINFIVYVRVLCALYKTSQQGHGESDVCKKFILSTFAFVVTGVVMIPLVLSFTIASFLPSSEEIVTVNGVDLERLHWIISVAACTSASFGIIASFCINIFFLMLKSHRDLWGEYWRRIGNNRGTM